MLPALSKVTYRDNFSGCMSVRLEVILNLNIKCTTGDWLIYYIIQSCVLKNC